MIDEVRRYADLHGMSISEVIREGVDMRLHGTLHPNEYDSNTSLPAPMVTMLTRLATTLTTAVDQLHSVCAGAVVSEGGECQIPSAPQRYNRNPSALKEEYNGNTISAAPSTAPQRQLQAAPQHSEACPPFDPAKFVLGKLCPQGHEWGKTGQARLRLPSRTCPDCANAARRQKRADIAQVLNI
jgi:hypothetical protein